MSYLTVKEVAELAGCNERFVQRKAKDGSWLSIKDIDDYNRPQYRFAISDLPPDIQRRYYSKQRVLFYTRNKSEIFN